MPKRSILASFWKPEACGQTVLPDRSVFIRQELVENDKIQKFKCDILSNELLSTQDVNAACFAPQCWMRLFLWFSNTVDLLEHQSSKGFLTFILEQIVGKKNLEEQKKKKSDNRIEYWRRLFESLCFLTSLRSSFGCSSNNEHELMNILASLMPFSFC